MAQKAIIWIVDEAGRLKFPATGTEVMLKKIVTGLALVAAVVLLVPESAFARGGHGGFHGGGFRGGGAFRGGGFSGRGFAAAPRAYGGARFYGGGARVYGGGARFYGAPGRAYVARNWNGGGWNNAYRYRRYGRYPYYGAAVAGAAIAGAYGAYYSGYPYYYDDECYQVVTVYGAYGPEARRVYVCE
jgi:hypothetical protein